ncbi:hypothetical protein N7450_003300 [Penicillium hetheringtonii]|nr:hypothetical protein N7450_003300 [Penicillium hetheringtonii]
MAPPMHNPFSIFGRGRHHAQPQPPTPQEEEEEEGFDDDYDPEQHEMEQDEEVSELEPEDQLDQEEGIDESDLYREELDDEVDEQLEDEDADEEMHDRERSLSPLPPNLREISSLASWTVSTSKPGCGVAALRHPSPMQYWQSDGPQPHTLTLHFFKLVAVVRIRVYLDFELDESYTPTKMVFLAGMGGNDLVEFATWEGDGPNGWVNISLEGVGGRNGGWVRDDPVRRKHRSNSAQRQGQASGPRNKSAAQGGDSNALDSEDDETDSQDENREENIDDPYTGNVLKAMVIQMRVMENHQNGKDTHVRGFQVFACDDTRRRMVAAPSASADGRHRRHSARQSFRGGDVLPHSRVEGGGIDPSSLMAGSGLEEPDWMGEPVIR